MKSFTVWFIPWCAFFVAGGLMITPVSHAAFPLPHYSEVEPTETLAIDGIWRITANNSRVRIEKGRGIAVDSWSVPFKGVVEPDKVSSKNIVYLGQGQFRGEDLTLSGNFIAKIQANGDLAFQVGLVHYVLTPVELDNPIEYIGMMTQAGLDTKNSPYLSNWIRAEKAKRDAREEIGAGEVNERDSTPPGAPRDEENPERDMEQPPRGEGDPAEQEPPGPGGDERPAPEAGDGSDREVGPETGDGGEEEIRPGPGEGGDEVVEPEPEPGGVDPGSNEDGEEFVEADPGDPRLQKIIATVHGRVAGKKLGCKGKDVYLSQGACYRCPTNYKRQSLTRKMDHPQACQKRGAPQYTYTAAKYVGKAGPIAGCPGKNVYRSDGGCYACPAGFKRASLTRKMTHAQACQERGAPKHTYAPARKLYELNQSLLACPRRQFAHNGYCKSCPSGTLRLHYLGVDTGYCLKKN